MCHAMPCNVPCKCASKLKKKWVFLIPSKTILKMTPYLISVLGTNQNLETFFENLLWNGRITPICKGEGRNLV